MPLINYALRESPLIIYQLAEGIVSSQIQTQISILRKRPVSPNFLSEYFYLDSKNTPIRGRLSVYGNYIASLAWENPYNYVAYIDSQIEFSINRSIIEKLQPSFFPVCAADTYLSFFEDQVSGYITIVRVYRAQQRIDESLTKKGGQGSSQIIKLYDSDEIETQVESGELRPVISENKFQYLKDELLSILKSNNSFITCYENTSEGVRLLKNRIDAERLLRPKMERQFDPDSEIDMAQIDYGAVFKEILQIAPGLEQLVNYATAIKPTQWGEIDRLSELYTSKNDSGAKNRLFDIHLRVALRMGLWASKKYNVDLEVAVQESIIGLIISLEKYNESYDGRFGNYTPLWIRQNIMRELPIGEKNCRLPVHFKDKFLPIYKWIEDNQNQVLYDENEKKRIIKRISKELSVGEERANQYMYLAIDALDLNEKEVVETLYSTETVEDTICSKIFEEEFRLIVERVLDTLNTREKDIIKKRYGFFGHEMTLEEIGAEYNLTRERIRQIAEKALRRLRHPTRSNQLKTFLHN